MADDPSKSGRKPDGRFGPGNRANPAGRPTGSRNKASLLLGELIDNEGEGIVRAMIKAATEGDVSAGRALLDRLVPPRRERPVRFILPPLVTASDAPRAVAAIVAAVASGDLTASEAADLSKLVADFVKAIEASDLAVRLSAIEKQLENRK